MRQARMKATPDKPLRAFDGKVPDPLLRELARVPADVVELPGGNRLEWRTKDGRYLQAADYGTAWIIFGEGHCRGGYIGSCMRSAEACKTARDVIAEYAEAEQPSLF